MLGLTACAVEGPGPVVIISVIVGILREEIHELWPGKMPETERHNSLSVKPQTQNETKQQYVNTKENVIDQRLLYHISLEFLFMFYFKQKCHFYAMFFTKLNKNEAFLNTTQVFHWLENK